MSETDTSLFDYIAYFESKQVQYWEPGEKNVTIGWINITCPFCGDHDYSGNNHLGINVKTKLFHCWICGEKGGPPKLIKELEECSWSTAYQIIESFLGDDIPQAARQRKTPIEIRIPPGSGNVIARHRKYLMSRGFESDIIVEKYKIMSGPMFGEFRGDIIIPFQIDGETVAFIGMDWTEKKEAKYRSSYPNYSPVNTKHIIYNIDSARQMDTLILMEGVTDVWRYGTGAVCTAGVTCTPEQLAFLAGYGFERIFVVFDGDDAGRTNAQKVANQLSGVVPNVYVIDMPEGKDPADLSDVEIEQLRKEING